MNKKFIRTAPKDLFLKDTLVENIFIGEYMAPAPSDFVKVYLFGLMSVEADYYIDNSIMAKQLSLDEEDVLKAWNYWEKIGVIRKINKNKDNKFDYTVEFIDQKALFYGNGISSDESFAKKSDVLDEDLVEIYKSVENITGRLLSGKEPLAILSLMEDYGATADIIVGAYQYCKKEKNKDSFSYVEKVVKNWTDKGLKTTKELEEYLSDVDKKYYQYKRIMKSLGFKRNVTEGERNIIDRWFDDMNFTIGTVLEACNKTSGISSPNINYVNKVLENWYKQANGKELKKNNESVNKNLFTPKDVAEYYQKIKRQNEEEASRKIREVYSKIPLIEKIDREIRELSMNMSRIMLSGGKYKSEDLKNKIRDLSEKKALALDENGYPLDYMDTSYRCSICQDTGTDEDGLRCKCYTKRLEELKDGK